MRHRVLSTRLKRTSGELKALLTNQTKQLIMRGQVTTTLSKAKILRPFAEKLVTLAKQKTFVTVKRAKAVLRDDAVTRVLFDEVAPEFVARLGGYTRIVRLGNRGGDNAPMARLEFVKAVTPKLPKSQKVDKKSAKKLQTNLETNKSATKAAKSKVAKKKDQKNAKD